MRNKPTRTANPFAQKYADNDQGKSQDYRRDFEKRWARKGKYDTYSLYLLEFYFRYALYSKEWHKEDCDRDFTTLTERFNRFWLS